jgi:undecaprenyl-diphosphatase
MAVTAFMSMVVRSRRLFMALFTWYLINIWSRLYLGQHFLTDIAVGTMWGIVSAIAGYYIYNKVYGPITSKKAFISEQYTVTGFAISDVNIVVTVFLLIVMAAMVFGIVNIL